MNIETAAVSSLWMLSTAAACSCHYPQTVLFPGRWRKQTGWTWCRKEKCEWAWHASCCTLYRYRILYWKCTRLGCFLYVGLFRNL